MFAEYLQLGTGVALARSTIDLYLSMAHEQANPVPGRRARRAVGWR